MPLKIPAPSIQCPLAATTEPPQIPFIKIRITLVIFHSYKSLRPGLETTDKKRLLFHSVLPVFHVTPTVIDRSVYSLNELNYLAVELTTAPALKKPWLELPMVADVLLEIR